MKNLLCRVWPLMVACALAGTAFGQDKPAEPVVVGRISMASLDTFNKLGAELGVPGAMLDNAGIEALPFIGAGGVATDRPLGVTLWAGDPQKLFPIQTSFVISVPVVKGKVTPADLAAAGGTPLAGVPDGFALGGSDVRRTGDYLHMKMVASSFGLSAVNDNLFNGDYKDPANLYALAADLATFRKAAPNAYQDLAKEITALPRMIGISTPDDPKPLLSVLDKIDRFTMTLSHDPANFLLTSDLTPSPFSTVPLSAPRPAFPAGVIGRMHLVYPTPEAAALLEKQLAELPEETFGLDMPLVYHQRAKDLVLRIAALNSSSRALSLGASMKDGRPTVYLVDQFSTDFDAVKEITDIVTAACALSQEGAGLGIGIEETTYTDGTHKVKRLTLKPDAAFGLRGDERVVIDEIQNGKTLYVALSGGDEKLVAGLADAGMDGQSTMIFAGELDMGGGMAALPATGVPGMSPEMISMLKTNWAGLKISFTLQSNDKGMQTKLQMPKQIVKDMMKMNVETAPAAPGQPMRSTLP